MKKLAFAMLGIILSSNALAINHIATHEVRLTGLEPGEGRFVLAAEYVNDTFRTGAYRCVGNNQTVYSKEYSLPKSKTPFHEDHLIKFSVCQDETLAVCQEFAVDKYSTFRALDGFLANDAEAGTIDISSVKNSFQACDPQLDEVVKNSIHLNDRRFAHVG